MKKKIFAVLALAFLLALSMAPAAWAATVASGECGAEGDNVTWVLDDTGTLTISGQGAIQADAFGNWNGNFDEREVNTVIINKGITCINDRVFLYCTNLSSVTIPDSVTSIGGHAFAGCINLASITIPNSVTSIGDYAFSGCDFTSINIPDSVTNIGEYAFANCGKFTSIVIPNSVTSIGKGVFSYCDNLENIVVDSNNKNYCTVNGVLYDIDKTRLCSYPATKEDSSFIIPDTVVTIGERAFGGCRNLVNIEIPDSVDTIEDYAFSVCSNLTDINIPNSMTNIGNGVFSECDSLTNVTIPESITSIGAFAFNDCSSLTNITIPNSVANIGDAAFQSCSSLTDITIPNSVTSIGSHIFNKCTSLTGIDILGNITVIDNGAFSECSSLTSITIPDSVTAIEANAFSYCDNLTSINLPDSLTSIGDYAFSDCEKLADVYYAGTEEQWKKIEISDWDNGNDNLINATIHYNSTGPEKPDTIPVTGITLDKTALTMEVKTTEQIKATVLPADTTSTISWTSSNEKVAIVDNTGKVTALTKGTATITAAADGIKAECVVTVTADDVYTITFDTDGGTLAAGITNPDYVIKGETYKMPGASKSRYTLKAWAIGSKDSQTQAKANDVYTFTEDTTVYAIWQYNGGGGGSHGGSSRPSGTTTTKPGTTEKPGDTNKPGTTTDNNKTVTAANVNNKFADVQNNAWYSEAIAYVYNKGMMNGTDAGKFEPDATTTRAMLVTMLFRLEGEPKAGAADFSDVASGQWFSEAIAWAAANGVVNGYKDGTFAPNDMITREQLAAVLYRFAQFKGYDVSVKGSLSNFSDSGSVSDWAQEAMQWAVGAGIINGDNGALKPAGNATRAEVAMMLMRFCENVAK